MTGWGSPGGVLTVTANPAWDETYTVSSVIPGSSHRVSPPLARAGGKGINVARVARQLGAPALAVTTYGGPRGELFRQDLDTSGIHHRLVKVDSDTRRSIAISDLAAGATTLFNETGLPLSPAEWQELRAEVEAGLPRADVLVGSGSLPAEAPAGFYPWLVGLAAARGIPCIIDTSGPDLLRAAEAGAFALKPNQQELMEATGETDLRRAAQSLINAGAQTVFLSCGEAGLLTFSRAHPDYYLQARLGRSLPGNPTGAGDAAVAAISVDLAAGSRDTSRMLRLAAACSSAAVLMPAAGEISPRFRDLAEQISVTRHRSRSTALEEDRWS